MDLSNPAYYINRELSWLEFNGRVLEEAQDKSNPVLERLKFLAITASNLDEFFMVRVSTLMDQVYAGITVKDPSGLTPAEQLAAVTKRAKEFVSAQYSCLNRSILPALLKEGIAVLAYDGLNAEQARFADEYFKSTLYPIITPMAVDRSRPFPLLNNKSLNIIVLLKPEKETAEKEKPKKEKKDKKAKKTQSIFAIVQVPTVVPRYLPLPASDSGNREFILLEDIIIAHMADLFTGYKVQAADVFRVTRNSDFEIDEDDTDDLLYEIEMSIKRRKWGDPVRLELSKDMDRASRAFLEKMLDLDPDDVVEINGPLDLTMWMNFSFIKGFDHLRDAPLLPQRSANFSGGNIFDDIRDHDILIHHPYETFDHVLEFVKTAAADPAVLAIKQTLYRVSGNSPIVNALITAAENGKQVTVLVELKARFDEENNIIWAKKLEKSGCHVVYGLAGLKTHCKLCLVVRREEDGIRRYVHLGTGNYNDSTAKIYTDLGLLTCSERFGQDVSALFNVLTGYSTNMDWHKIAVAPITLRNMFLHYIRVEAEHAAAGKEAAITAKMNSLVDMQIIQELYKASMAGVKIKLIVRGICCLRAGIPGVSDNITVVSIVDRFLEHSRIFYFENLGQPKIFLSSADWMPRNLDRRVEVAFPIESADMQAKVVEVLDVTLSDTVKLRVMRPDGSYARIDKRGKELIQSQALFHDMAVNRARARDKRTNGTVFKPIFHKETIEAE